MTTKWGKNVREARSWWLVRWLARLKTDAARLCAREKSDAEREGTPCWIPRATRQSPSGIRDLVVDRASHEVSESNDENKKKSLWKRRKKQPDCGYLSSWDSWPLAVASPLAASPFCCSKFWSEISSLKSLFSWSAIFAYSFVYRRTGLFDNDTRTHTSNKLCCRDWFRMTTCTSRLSIQEGQVGHAPQPDSLARMGVEPCRRTLSRPLLWPITSHHQGRANQFLYPLLIIFSSTIILNTFCLLLFVVIFCFDIFKNV